MIIKVFLIKILAKCQSFLSRQYTGAKTAERLIKFICSCFIATQFYFYFADLGVPTIVSFVGTSIVIYALLCIGYVLLKIFATIIKRLKTRNIALFLLSSITLYYFISELESQTDFETTQQVIFSAVGAVVIMTFAKSIATIKNKKVLPVLTSIITIAVVGVSVAFAVFPGRTEKTDEYIGKKTSAIESEIIYPAAYLDFTGENVNLSPYVSYSGMTKKIRDKYFSKNLSEVPIRGRLWYPKGAKNIPIVIMAHGNHRFTENSYLGYDYLGKMLARQGIAMASVDMNMLNGFMKYGLKNENDARAILMLSDLEYLLRENENKDSKIYGLINKNNIALMGHSRGGEAASIAASFTELKYNPSTSEQLNYNFKINSVVAIAPTVNQYKPAGKEVALEDVNYLSIHGTHDADVVGFNGMKTYNNTKVKNDNLKVAMYIGYANHGNFNSLWGMDSDPPKSYFFNRSALLKAEEQEEITALIISEFLKTSFFKTGDSEFLKNPEKYEEVQTPIWSRYQTGSFELIEDFENTYDLTKFKYGKVRFDGVKVGGEKYSIGGFETDNSALTLSGKGEYILSFDEYIQPKKYLSMDIMTNAKDYTFTGFETEVEIIDSFGNSKSVKLNEMGQLVPKIKIELSKFQEFRKDYEYKNSLKTFRIPMDEFNIDKTQIKYIKIKTQTGDNLVVDNIGYFD